MLPGCRRQRADGACCPIVTPVVQRIGDVALDGRRIRAIRGHEEGPIGAESIALKPDTAADLRGSDIDPTAQGARGGWRQAIIWRRTVDGIIGAIEAPFAPAARTAPPTPVR